jgi:hypothetical protein
MDIDGSKETSEPAMLIAQQRTGRIVACLTTSGLGKTEFETTLCDSLSLDHEGIIGNRHRGWLRKADARVPYLKRGTPIRNTRMLSIVSVADLATASQRLGVARIDPAWVGANLLVDGLAWFSYLPRGTKLIFADGAILTLEDQNAPCRIAGAAIARHTGKASVELEFAKCCQGLRGVVVSVERPGLIAAHGEFTARIPAQWLYPA